MNKKNKNKESLFTFNNYLELKEKLQIEVDDDLLTDTAIAKLQYLEVFIILYYALNIKF